MDRLGAMEVFITVAETGSFAAAARRLEISTSAASRKLADLEKWLGVTLLQRTTRKLSLTAAGQDMLERCRRITDEVEALGHRATQARAQPKGLLRVTASDFLARHWLGRVIATYVREYPDITVELIAADRPVDLVKEGFDIAIRAGQLKDSSLVARRIATTGARLVASPDYLETHGRPESPDQLRKHRCILEIGPSFGDRWPVGESSRFPQVTRQPVVRVNSGEIARDLAVAGCGIAILPEFMVRATIEEGRLVSLLEQSVRYEMGVFIVYPQSKYLPINTRSFRDYVIAHGKSFGTLGPSIDT